MIAMITSAISSKFRLLLEYGMVLVIVVMGGFVATLWFQKKNMEVTVATLESDIVAINLVNEHQQETIGDLLHFRELDAKAIESLLNNEDLSRRANIVLEDKLRELEIQNESVRDFLDIPIPPELCPIARYCAPAVGNTDSSSTSGAPAGPPN